MKGTTILLLGAATLVAYASAHPYLKIPDSLPDEYNYKKSSSNSNSNSYSQSNQDEADVNGAFHGQSFSGSKTSGYSTNGGSHSQSSSFTSSTLNGNVPLGIFGFPAVPQNPNTYSQSSLAFGNPGTAGLGLSNTGSGFSSGSYSSSYGTSNGGSSNSGISDDKIIEGAQGADSSGSYIGAGIGSIESSLNTDIQGGNSGSNSGIYGFSGGPSIGQAGIPITSSHESSGTGHYAQTGSQPGAVQYWWNGENSPFGSAGKPTGGCKSNACSLSGSFDLNKGAGGAHASNDAGQVVLNIGGGNPFFSKGQAGSGSDFISSGASVGQSAIGSTVGAVFGSGSEHDLNSGPIDGSKNPFFNGAYTPGSSGSSFTGGPGSFASSHSGAGVASSGSNSLGSSSSSGSFIGAGNPFLKPGSGFGQTSTGSGQVPTVIPGYTASQSSGFGNAGAGSLNPFFKPGSGSVVLTHPVTNFPDQSSQGLPHPSSTPGFPIQSTISGSLTPQQPIRGIPSLKPGSGSVDATPGYSGSSSSFGSAGAGDYQGQIDQISTFSSQSTIGSGSSSAGYPTISTSIPEQKPSSIDGGLTVSCSGEGRICVLKNLCANGRVSGNAQGLQQVRTGPQLCNVDREVCCTLNKYSGLSTSFGTAQGGSASNSNSGSGSYYGGFSGTYSKPTVPSVTISHGQSTGSTGIHGQTGQFGSTSSYEESGKYDQSGSLGSSGIIGQAGQSGSANSYDQSQQKQSFNFGIESNSKASAGSSSSVGNQNGNGFTSGFLSGSSSGTPAPNLISVTPGSGYRKPAVTGYTGGNSGYASVGASANAQASSQAGSGVSSSYIHPSPTPSIGGTFSNNRQPGQSSGGLFSSNVNSGEDLSAGEPSYPSSSSVIKGASASNGYLPPFGSEPSSNVPAFSNPPKEESEPSVQVPNIKRPPPRPTEFVPAPITVHVGCAAALICVEEKFCTLEGVISPQPVALTSQQIARRAPLSSCKNPDNGIIGKCCRDPNYVDPWPTGNLPANYSGGFDEQGFPSYLNYAKTHPPKKQPLPTKGGFQQSSKVPVSPNLTGKDWSSDLADHWKNVTNFLGQWGYNPAGSNENSENSVTSDGNTDAISKPPTSDEAAVENPPKPGIFDLSFPNLNIPNIPNIPNFPSFGSFPTLPSLPFVSGERKTYDSSATNQSPAIIAPHTPGVQCGLRNKVQRPSDLEQDDTAFGEITWQAMVLSTEERKLLCSGAIVSPNAVLTAAHCVAGFKSGEVSIKAGEWKLGYELKHEEPLPFEIVKVSNIVSHPGFQLGSASHDLAILFLEHPVALDQHVDILCLGDVPQPILGRKCIATGWGKIVLQVNVAGALMHSIDVDIVPQDECKYRLQGAESRIEIDNTLTCAKPHYQRNNLCQVDVGGPLACDRGDGFYELTGIYNQDTGCLPTNQVATFALIDTNWVKKNLLSPPRQPPSYPVNVPYFGESPSSTNVQTNFGAQVNPPAATCECQKSHLPPDLNQYLPPV